MIGQEAHDSINKTMDQAIRDMEEGLNEDLKKAAIKKAARAAVGEAAGEPPLKQRDAVAIDVRESGRGNGGGRLGDLLPLLQDLLPPEHRDPQKDAAKPRHGHNDGFIRSISTEESSPTVTAEV